ncbi:hypothetical protein DUNSADRAFT_14543 [Dunaliella salina]|uniref:Encoded protein n=1 Tax=Dunaliella salina TaxID=3046 RepID=A0ABQ7G779_DUNSA|nr:hypothetical protein DUNSADRAFT_14543 [Dunaliella salina]|eukprot:KAF5830462.1 hypothetical protein DUNSADRAFT_14543 [Dunaliella salina]
MGLKSREKADLSRQQAHPFGGKQEKNASYDTVRLLVYSQKKLTIFFFTFHAYEDCQVCKGCCRSRKRLLDSIPTANSGVDGLKHTWGKAAVYDCEQT